MCALKRLAPKSDTPDGAQSEIQAAIHGIGHRCLQPLICHTRVHDSVRLTKNKNQLIAFMQLIVGWKCYFRLSRFTKR